MTVRFRPGHCSVKQAARILRVTYWTVLKLIARGELRGGRYARVRKHGRFVTMDSVLHLHAKKLAIQTERYIAARRTLEGSSTT